MAIWKNIKFRLGSMLIFIVAAYLPFFICLIVKYDTTKITLSGIGWREGGLEFLLIYIFLTVPAMIYQIFLFLNLSNRKSNFLKSLILTGGMMIAVGALFPVRETSPEYSHFLHSALCQIGGVLSILSVTFMIIFYCKENKEKIQNVTILYGELFITVAICFILLETPALLEVGASLLFLIVMFIINGILLYEDEKNKQITIKENVNDIEHLKKEKKKGVIVFVSFFGSAAALMFFGGMSIVFFNPVAAITKFASGITLIIVGIALGTANIRMYRKLARYNTK